MNALDTNEPTPGPSLEKGGEDVPLVARASAKKRVTLTTCPFFPPIYKGRVREGFGISIAIVTVSSEIFWFLTFVMMTFA